MNADVAPKSATQRAVVAWLPAAAYMALIWVLSSMSHPPSMPDVPFRDKGIHFMEYGVLAALIAHAFAWTRPSRRMLLIFGIAVVCATLFGLTDEIHQAFVPGRNSDPQDLLADGLGSLLGACAYLVLLRLVVKRAR
ncbi:MAG TPA: VanZ family protein [Polyangiales bacterium]|nr:VanZ family protein [Polyangiales bacterium]